MALGEALNPTRSRADIAAETLAACACFDARHSVSLSVISGGNDLAARRLLASATRRLKSAKMAAS